MNGVFNALVMTVVALRLAVGCSTPKPPDFAGDGGGGQGVDAGLDAGADASGDASPAQSADAGGVDAGGDAGDDAAVDAGGDAAVDAGQQTIADSGPPEPLFSETIPGSRNHSPDGTWWGYNQVKIVRFGSRVFTYVIENDDDAGNPSLFAVHVKQADAGWTRGASFATSRPGNLLVDSTGVLHAFVFEPTNLPANDSIGRLKHYAFPGAPSGDIADAQGETIVENDGSVESVNIRVGAAIGANDTMAVAFGLTTTDGGQTEQLYFRRAGEAQWTISVAGTALGHDNYYPFVLVTDAGFALLPIQDDYTGQGNPNVYQIVTYFERVNGVWSAQVLSDLTAHAFAATRPRLLEQSDLFEDARGVVHVVLKEFLDPVYASSVSTFKHLTRLDGGWDATALNLSSASMNWLRMVEVDGGRYFVGASWNTAYILRENGSGLTPLNIPNMIVGSYPYVGGPRGGSRSSEAFVDVLLLSGASASYPNATNLYVRIPKSLFLSLP